MRLKNRIDIFVFPVHNRIDVFVFPVHKVDARAGLRQTEISAHVDLNEKVSNVVADAIVLGDVLTAATKNAFSFTDYIVLGDSATVRGSIRPGFDDGMALDDSAKLGFLIRPSFSDYMLLGDDVTMTVSRIRRFSDMTGDTFDTLKNMSFEELKFIN